MNRTAAGREWEEVAADVAALSIVQILGKEGWVELWAAVAEPLAGQPGVVAVPGDTILKDQLDVIFPDGGKLFARSAEPAIVSCI
jgi:hypothetical protein